MARSFRELFATAKRSAAYWAELATLDFTAELDERMRQLDMSRAELAQRIGTSPAYVTKVLNGRTNFTIFSMASLAHAVGRKVTIRLEDEEAAEQSVSTTATFTGAAAPARGRLTLISKHNEVLFDAINESRFDTIAKAA